MAVQIRDVMGVMDTVEKLANAEKQTSRAELRSATRAAYRDQDLSVPDHLLEQALDIHEKKNETAILPWLEPDSDKLEASQDPMILEGRTERFVSPSSFSLLEVIMMLNIMVCAMMAIFVIYGSLDASRRAEEDVQHLTQMTASPASENASQAIASGALNGWLRDRAAQGERFEIAANAQNPQWSDIETVGLPVRACATFASDPQFKVTWSGASPHPTTLSASDCQRFSPNERLLLHRVR